MNELTRNIVDGELRRWKDRLAETDRMMSRLRADLARHDVDRAGMLRTISILEADLAAADAADAAARAADGLRMVAALDARTDPG